MASTAITPTRMVLNQLKGRLKTARRGHKLLRHIREGDCVYFVHSFYAEGCDDSLIATAEYGREITAIVGRENVMGCQFHPEKSGAVGLSILRAFCEEAL